VGNSQRTDWTSRGLKTLRGARCKGRNPSHSKVTRTRRAGGERDRREKRPGGGGVVYALEDEIRGGLVASCPKGGGKTE